MNEPMLTNFTAYRLHSDEHGTPGDEAFEIEEDIRHGRPGFRVVRRVWDGTEFIWDESYQFYPSLDAFYAAFKVADYKAGVDAF